MEGRDTEKGKGASDGGVELKMRKTATGFESSDNPMAKRRESSSGTMASMSSKDRSVAAVGKRTRRKSMGIKGVRISSSLEDPDAKPQSEEIASSRNPLLALMEAHAKKDKEAEEIVAKNRAEAATRARVERKSLAGRKRMSMASSHRREFEPTMTRDTSPGTGLAALAALRKAAADRRTVGGVVVDPSAAPPPPPAGATGHTSYAQSSVGALASSGSTFRASGAGRRGRGRGGGRSAMRSKYVI